MGTMDLEFYIHFQKGTLQEAFVLRLSLCREVGLRELQGLIQRPKNLFKLALLREPNGNKT